VVADRTGISSPTDGWRVTVQADYSVQLLPVTTGDPIQGKAQAKLIVWALDSGTVQTKETTFVEVTDGNDGFGSQKSGVMTVSFELGANIDEIEIQVKAITSETTNADATAEAGYDVDNTRVTSRIASATDHVGRKGAIWRNSSSQVTAELNATGAAGVQTSNPGEMYLRDTLTENSDRRDKEDITRVSDPMEVLSEIGGYSYTKNGSDGYGVMAQEVRDAGASALVSEGNDERLALNYSGLHAFEVEALTDHERRIRQLEKENDRLTKLVNTLSA